MRLAANLTWLFTERPFLERFGAAAAAGFTAVECLFPYDHHPEAIAAELAAHRLEMALINAPPGDWAAGERGFAAIPGREAEFAESLAEGLRYARALGAKRLHVLSGLAGSGDAAARACWLAAMRRACGEAAPYGIEILAEPLNKRDAPGYFLNDFNLAEDLIRAAERPNLRLQFDIYHRQILHGDVIAGLRRLTPLIGHIQIASVPARAEPTTGELNDALILREIKALGYAGFVGCEYRPAADTETGLIWREAAGFAKLGPEKTSISP